MSRRLKKKHHTHTAETQIRPDSSLRQEYLPLLAVIILAGIPFAAGKYIEFNSAGAFDSGAYVYSAEHVLRGAKLGIDETPGAQVGTLLVNMLGIAIFGFGETGSKIIQMIMQAGAIAFMFITLRKLFGNLSAVIGATIASMYLSAPLIAKYGNVKEQYMIAVMIVGICCYTYRQLGGKWWWAFLSGAVLAYGPLFKQTGVSAIIAVGLFTIAQPFLKNRTVKQTITDILLLFAGALSSLLPLYVWLLVWHSKNYLPYQFVFDALISIGTEKATGLSYVTEARNLTEFPDQFARVMRYYGLLVLPISLAVISITTRLIRWLIRLNKKISNIDTRIYEKFVLLFGLWWLCDMAFVWISPRSYEQYYLPLNGSAAMTGGYILAIYSEKFGTSKNKTGWFVAGIIGFIVMISMGWHIVFGITASPHSGAEYGQPSRGYIPRIEEIKQAKRENAESTWELAAEYIRQNTTEKDTIFVWGWFPGIYMKAQRLSCTNRPFTSEMHVMSPEVLKTYIDELVSDLQNGLPKYLVDTHKVHYPWNRPPLELWPTTERGLLPNKPQIIELYEHSYKNSLAEQIDKSEAQRFMVMKPLRDFVMNNYTPIRSFGQFIVFELKKK
ncbi:MAG: glycosyltransferase family 39 protein [Phycisphaerae bacterium]|nr:glycosyltransferase family 39 protein [Phycisphaerae bacterium]